MVALDSELNCPSWGGSIFHGSDVDFQKLEKNCQIVQATLLKNGFREILYFEQNPPKIYSPCLPLKIRHYLLVFYALFIHGRYIKFWYSDNFKIYFFQKFTFSPPFVIVGLANQGYWREKLRRSVQFGFVLQWKHQIFQGSLCCSREMVSDINHNKSKFGWPSYFLPWNNNKNGKFGCSFPATSQSYTGGVSIIVQFW